MLDSYCKHCYFCGINFSRFAAQKHIRGLLNSRWADAHCHFCTAQSQYHSMNDTFTSMYVTGQHKNKAGLRQTWVYPLHQHTWSIHNSYVSNRCIQNIANIFAGFWIPACWICAKYAKINVPQIFPLTVIHCRGHAPDPLPWYWLTCYFFAVLTVRASLTFLKTS